MTTLVETPEGAIRRRRPCEFPKFDHSHCLDKTDWREEYENLEEKHKIEIESLEEEHKLEIESLEVKQEAYINFLQQGTVKVLDLLLKYGNHLSSCNLCGLKLAGRITNLPEEETCSCGWTETKKMINKVRESGSLTEKEIDILIEKYMITRG